MRHIKKVENPYTVLTPNPNPPNPPNCIETAELRLLKEANTVSSNALSNARDEAAGTRYTTSLKTTWTAPKHILAMSEAQHQAIREKWSILVEGEDIPAPSDASRT